jgi:hypothetical protein
LRAKSLYTPVTAFGALALASGVVQPVLPGVVRVVRVADITVAARRGARSRR